MAGVHHPESLLCGCRSLVDLVFWKPHPPTSSACRKGECWPIQGRDVQIQGAAHRRTRPPFDRVPLLDGTLTSLQPRNVSSRHTMLSTALALFSVAPCPSWGGGTGGVGGGAGACFHLLPCSAAGDETDSSGADGATCRCSFSSVIAAAPAGGGGGPLAAIMAAAPEQLDLLARLVLRAEREAERERAMSTKGLSCM